MELSALRDVELAGLVRQIPSLDLRQFAYVAIHAPSAFRDISEGEAVSLLLALPDPEMPIVMHPDAIQDPRLWKQFGTRLLLENMDKRKAIGRTSEELSSIFDELPRASLCFDIGHAYQVDPTMCVAAQILRDHRSRVRHLHVSEVDTASKHRPLSLASLMAFHKVICDIDEALPVILESMVGADRIEHEIRKVRTLFNDRSMLARMIPD